MVEDTVHSFINIELCRGMIGCRRIEDAKRQEEPTKTTRVADHVGGSNVCNGRVGVVRLTNILVRRGDVAIDNQGLEVVMGKDRREEGRGGQEA